MIINMGQADRIIRPLLAVVFLLLYLTGTVTGVVGIILLVLAAIFLLTSAIGFCPLYRLLGFNTCTTRP